jgi:hypothetical protein
MTILKFPSLNQHRFNSIDNKLIVRHWSQNRPNGPEWLFRRPRARVTRVRASNTPRRGRPAAPGAPCRSYVRHDDATGLARSRASFWKLHLVPGRPPPARAL